MSNSVLNWLASFAVLAAGAAIVLFVPDLKPVGYMLAGSAGGWLARHLAS
jgi:hypothetical protein